MLLFASYFLIIDNNLIKLLSLLCIFYICLFNLNKNDQEQNMLINFIFKSILFSLIIIVYGSVTFEVIKGVSLVYSYDVNLGNILIINLLIVYYNIIIFI